MNTAPAQFEAHLAEVIRFLGPLQPQELVLDIFGFHPKKRTEAIAAGALVVILEEVGFSTAGARIALARLVRRGLLDRVRRGRYVWYRPTPRMLEILEEGDQRIFSFGRLRPANSGWTVLWHALPVNLRYERGQLARRLRFLGFGSPQDGLWISPRNHEQKIVELAESMGISDHCSMLIARKGEGLDLEPLIARAWNLEALASRYAAFNAAFSPYAGRRLTLNDRDAFVVRISAVDAFRRFASLDPELPDGASLDPRLRTDAVRIFNRLDRALAPAGARYLRNVEEAAPRLTSDDAVKLRREHRPAPGERAL